MTTLLYSQTASNAYKNDSKESETLTKETYSISLDDYKTAVEVLQMAEIKHTKNATMFLCQTISNKYKEVSESISSTSLKPQRKKKTMQEYMKQSVFHGASWLGSNFIA